MRKNGIKLFAIIVLLSYLPINAQRITVDSIYFKVDSNRIWLNGTNTPWDNWNDFGGNFDYNWWKSEFEKLKDYHINCTRVWITCSGDSRSLEINSAGFISGVSDAFWEDVDSLMSIAQQNEIYLMIALISFDHSKPGNPNAQKWLNMYKDSSNRQSFVDNYAIPFVERYKDNPYFFAIDVGNELEWAWEIHGAASNNVIDLVDRVTDAVHENSEILVCQGWGTGPKYNSTLYEGNYLAEVDVDFYNLHYYDWQNQWFSNPFVKTPSYYQINTKPCIIGEAPAKGVSGFSAQRCYQKCFENGWQGLMVWTSNGVDINGNKYDARSGTNWIYNNYWWLVEATKQPDSIPVTGIEISYCPWNALNVGDSMDFAVNFTPVTATNQDAVWITSDSSILSIDSVSGVVIARNPGTATVFVSSKDGGFIDSCEVEVKQETGIIEHIKHDPNAILYEIFPNPFNDVTQIKFYLPNPGKTSLEIHNLQGQLIKILENNFLESGIYHYQWNAQQLASGTYICSLVSDNKILTKKVLYIK